jgi:hypothetical protein
MSDDAARFLRELRQLRNGAGLGHAELAARAHYPYDTIRDAEVGPSLPDLPVLSAFVRGCGGTTEEWEERWRSLNRTPSLPLATARQAGHSDAADAGARLGATTPAGDAPDPSIIMAALNRVAEEMSTPQTDLPTRSELPTRSAGSAKPPESPAPFSPWDKSASDGASASSGSWDGAFSSGAAASSAPWDSAPSNSSSSGGGSGESGWGKSAGSAWDPIRMSAAWPVLKDDAALLPDPSADHAPAASTARAPWDTAPWAEDPAALSAAAPSFPDLTSETPSVWTSTTPETPSVWTSTTPETPSVWTGAGTTSAPPPTAANPVPSRPTTSVSAPGVPVASSVPASGASASSASASGASTRVRTGGHARAHDERTRSSSLIAFVVAIVAVLVLMLVLYLAFG